MVSKLFPNATEALAGVTFDGMVVMSGGFGLAGAPLSLIAALKESGVTDLTVVSNNCGTEGYGLWELLNNGQIRKMIASYIGENKLFERLVLAGKLELELNPQGTLAERIRCGGAGIPAFYTRTGVGTVVADGKPVEEFDGVLYLRERWLRADLAIVKAWKGDTAGNLVYRRTARNFNPVMATAAAMTIAEVEHLVEAGEIDPDTVHTPGIYIQRIVLATERQKRIEKRTTRPRLEVTTGG
jgi:3-oxoacid CoA-transferase subunit A